MQSLKQLSTVAALGLILSACGGGGSSSSPAVEASASPSPETSPSPEASPSPSPLSSPSPSPSPLTGNELNAQLSKPYIEGLRYQTETQQGTSSSTGEYFHLDGEQVAFFIGDAEIANMPVGDSSYLFELAGSYMLSDTTLINFARLLYSLDEDAEASNGIQIAEQAHTQAQGLNIDFASASFDTDVANLVANSGSLTSTLLSADEVRALLVDELDHDRSCERDGANVGAVADFTTFAHGVEGRARILNNCTLEVTNFNYDGQGLGDVRFYDLDSRQSLGDNLFGQVWDNATVLVTLTPSEIAMLENLSVWCIPIGASFGNASFDF
ncbi:DM13 domain-containing protein [Agaribacterium sp. ZY112]|uniref:DM13 domain-containing protein n=1 Tax=Agaribacterium sp. ZY112 TaxID=3233574 RepID=UPI003523AC84